MSDTAKRIVKKIIEDISDRSGLGNEFEIIDDETKKEIENEWEEIIDKELEKVK